MTCLIIFTIIYHFFTHSVSFVTEKVSAISVYEVKSKTLESQPKDIWCFEIYCDNQTNLISLKKEVQELAELNNIEITSDIISEEIENKDWVALYQNQLAPI